MNDTLNMSADMADATEAALTAEGREASTEGYAVLLREAWRHGDAANVWKARAAYLWAKRFPSGRDDTPYNGKAASDAAVALGITGLSARQFLRYAKAGAALAGAGQTAWMAEPTEAEAAIVRTALDTARNGTGTRVAGRTVTPPPADGGSGRGPVTTVTTEDAPNGDAPEDAPDGDAPEGMSWADDVLDTLRRFARNATSVVTTEAEREAIAEAAAHLVARLEAEAERRAATEAAGDAARRNVAEAEAAKAAREAEAATEAAPVADAPKPAPRRRKAA